jgi:hypothetical protein
MVALDGTSVIQVLDSSPQALTAGGRAGIFDYSGASQPLDHFTVAAGSMPSPSNVLAQDEFSIPGALGGPWTTWTGSFLVASGAAHSAAPRSYATIAGVAAADVRVSALVSPNGLNDSGVLARALGDRNHYVGWLDQNGSAHVARRNDWSYTYLADATPQLTGPHKLTLSVSGNGPVHITLYLDDNPVIDVMDATVGALTSAGAVGIFSWQGAGPTFQHFLATQP